MNKKQKHTHPEVGEDSTQYGEFVSSYFAWVPLPDQKEKAEEMVKMTKKGTKCTRYKIARLGTKCTRYKITHNFRGGKDDI